MTVNEIAATHDVSRQTIHTYRRTGVFPSPVEGEGSTRLRFREDEVAAFFKANPKQPRKKRRPQPQGEPAVIQEQVSKPDFMTDEQWSAFVFGILAGVVKGSLEAGVNASWGTDLATAAVRGARARLDELMTGEAQDG
jgi:predicted DNA-binding transcriptional regulator AlpA